MLSVDSTRQCMSSKLSWVFQMSVQPQCLEQIGTITLESPIPGIVWVTTDPALNRSLVWGLILKALEKFSSMPEVPQSDFDFRKTDRLRHRISLRWYFYTQDSPHTSKLQGVDEHLWELHHTWFASPFFSPIVVEEEWGASPLKWLQKGLSPFFERCVHARIRRTFPRKARDQADESSTAWKNTDKTLPWKM